MSENTPIQINFKTKKDGMLINLRANDGAELDNLLNQITEVSQLAFAPKECYHLLGEH